MGFLGSGDTGHPMMNLINLCLRVCQFLLAITALGLYANEIQVEDKYSGDGQHFAKTVTAIVVSVLSLITASIFAILPFITANFFHVAVCFVWDFIIFCIWCAVFAFFHSIFRSSLDEAYYNNAQRFNKDYWARNQAAVWVDLTCLLLWLATTLLGLFGVVVWVRRRGSRTAAF